MAGGLNRNITVRLLADASQYDATMARVGSETESVSKTLEGTGAKTKLVTTGLAAAGTAAIALGVQAVRMAADFDASMSTVQANTGASADEMGQLRQAALDAGASTVYSASEAAGAINELGKAGMSTTDILSGGLSGALDLAASDGMDVSEAAELMSTALSQFNLTGADATRVADALAAGAGKAQGSAHDLGYALSQAGMVANMYGISMEETVGSLAAFAHAGMIGSDAGTSLKSMLVALANPSDKAAAAMEDIGLEAYDAQGKFVGLSALAGNLKGSLEGLTDAQKQQALATIFGTDGMRAAAVLYQEGAEGIKDWTGAVTESGYAAEQAAAKNDNLKGDLENLSGTFETFLINIGEGGQGPLRGLVQMLDQLLTAVSSLPAPVQQALILGTALVGGTAALHSKVGDLATSSSGLARNLGLVIDPMQRIQGLSRGVRDAVEMLRVSNKTYEAQIEMTGVATNRAGVRMSALKSVAGGVMDLMGGPWGVALSVAGAALAIWSSETQAAQQRTEEFTSALESGRDVTSYLNEELGKADTSAWTSGIGGLITQYDSLWEAVDKVGIAHDQFIEAIKGDDTAMANVQARLDKFTEISDMAAKSAAETGTVYVNFDQTAAVVSGGLAEMSDRYKQSVDAINAQKTAQKESTQASLDKTSALLTGKDATDDVVAANAEAATSEDILKNYFGATKDAVSEQASALGQVIKALNTYFGFAISASDSTIQLESAIDKASGAVDKNGRTLDLNTEKGRANQSALNDVAQAAQQAMLAHAKNGDTVEQLTPIVDRARDSFITMAQKMGMSKSEAEQAADKYGLTRSEVERLTNAINQVPTAKRTLITVDGLDDAINKVRQLGGQINALKSKQITVTQSLQLSGWVKTAQGTAPTPGSATGGLKTTGGFSRRGYASGGHVQGLLQGPGTGTSDSIWLSNARLSNGEFVVNARSVQHYGAGLFAALNRRQVPMATGGAGSTLTPQTWSGLLSGAAEQGARTLATDSGVQGYLSRGADRWDALVDDMTVHSQRITQAAVDASGVVIQSMDTIVSTVTTGMGDISQTVTAAAGTVSQSTTSTNGHELRLARNGGDTPFDATQMAGIAAMLRTGQWDTRIGDTSMADDIRMLRNWWIKRGSSDSDLEGLLTTIANGGYDQGIQYQLGNGRGSYQDSAEYQAWSRLVDRTMAAGEKLLAQTGTDKSTLSVITWGELDALGERWARDSRTAVSTTKAAPSKVTTPVRTATVAPSLSKTDVVDAVVAALQRMPDMRLKLNNGVMAGELAPAISRELGVRQSMGLR